MLGNVGECPSTAPNKKLMKVLKGKEVKEGTGCQRWGSQAAPLPSDCYGCGGAHPLRGGYLWYRRRPACLKGGSGRWVPHLYITFPVCQNSLVAVFAFIAAVICIVFLRYLYIYFFLDFFWKWEVGSANRQQASGNGRNILCYLRVKFRNCRCILQIIYEKWLENLILNVANYKDRQPAELTHSSIPM